MKKTYLIFTYRSMLSLVVGILLFSVLSPANCFGQSKERTRLRSYFFIDTDGTRQISIILTSGRGRNMQNVANATIDIEAELGDSTLYLTELITDNEGEVDLYVQPGYQFPANDEGITTLIASFAGNDTLGASSTDMEIKDVFLEMRFEIEDSVKILTIQARERNGEGELIPVEGLDIRIGVQRLYSVLPLDEIETDEEGTGIYEFPDDIPGDSVGMITVVARVDEHDLFGTVTKKQSIDWGLPVSYELKKMSRQLFTDEAPLWMIIAVFIVLVGAWYHFFLSVFKLRKIKYLADEE